MAEALDAESAPGSGRPRGKFLAGPMARLGGVRRLGGVDNPVWRPSRGGTAPPTSRVGLPTALQQEQRCRSEAQTSSIRCFRSVSARDKPQRSTRERCAYVAPMNSQAVGHADEHEPEERHGGAPAAGRIRRVPQSSSMPVRGSDRARKRRSADLSPLTFFRAQQYRRSLVSEFRS